MPNLASSKKAYRQALKKNRANRRILDQIKKYLKSRGADDLRKAQALIDKAAKRGIIQDNKAARLKSKLFSKKTARS